MKNVTKQNKTKKKIRKRKMLTFRFCFVIVIFSARPTAALISGPPLQLLLVQTSLKGCKFSFFTTHLNTETDGFQCFVDFLLRVCDMCYVFLSIHTTRKTHKIMVETRSRFQSLFLYLMLSRPLFLFCLFFPRLSIHINIYTYIYIHIYNDTYM